MGQICPVRFGGFCHTRINHKEAIYMNKKRKIGRKLLSFLLTLTMIVGLMPGMWLTAKAADGDTTYTITIPSTLNVSGSGWNATDGISATGTLASGKKLTVTANSGDEFALVSGENKVIYKLATASTDTEATTSWEFTELSDTASTKPMGIIVEDYSSKPTGTYQDTVTFTAKVEDAATVVDLSTLSADYEAQNGEVLTGTLAANVKISIADGATVTLKDLNITNLGNGCNWAGINCPGDATLVLKGTNTICAGRDGSGYNNYPGILIASGKTLTIDGDGSLTAYSNATEPYGAGIGGGFKVNCGNIVINGGTITATGGRFAAGIGSGGYKEGGVSCGSITINGGTITATGGENGAGIGSGYKGSCGDITITNTVTKVTATKRENAQHSIGNGSGGSCGTVTIGGTTGYISESPYTYQP